MAKIVGINAMIYINNAELPSRNAWSLNITRELQEARVFQAVNTSGYWVDQSSGFKSWSGSLNGYYDDSSAVITGLSVGTGSNARAWIHLYENRATLSAYWYGAAWIEANESVSPDGFAELNVDFTGDGQLFRYGN